MTQIQIFNKQNKVKPISYKIINTVVNYTVNNVKHLQKIQNKIKKINIIFIDNEEMTRMNTQFLGKNYPTDVLVFNYAPEESEIFISLQQCCINAKIYKQKDMHEILRVIIHGVLHLFGYDDNRRDTRNKMWQLQENILHKIIKKNQFSKL